jgi:transcription termination/antitermination protein NusG
MEECPNEPPAADFNEALFQVGERVRVLIGPFADFAGVVRAVDTVLQKLNVRLELFSRETPVVLDYNQAAKLEPDTE